ncbi:MAG: ABC transporter permease, partial [Candidatus Krumholzibacteriota bacterium]|nr:ABC transporter permease [Candidatus Krumholzibacteriota bacterium]
IRGNPAIAFFNRVGKGNPVFRHFMKIFVRSFRSNILINLLNLLGLSVGLSACMLIIIFLHHEFSYDAFQEKGDRIVRVYTDQKVGEGQEIRIPGTSYPVAEGLAREIGGIENFVRFRFSGGSRPVYVEDKIFYEEHLAWADSTLFDIFSYRLVQGDPRSVLSTRESVVLSNSTARKFFGEADPVGRRIRLNSDRFYTVTGVMEDIPQPSHLPSFPMIFSLVSLDIPGADYWVGRSMYGSYLLLREGQTAAGVQPVADRVYREHAGELLETLSAECSVTLQPLKEIHFDNSFDFQFDYQPTITYRKITVFALLAVFILLIAAVSFINLATARSGERARQVGISKAIGASRNSLVGQFLGEFVITSLAALVLSFLLVQLLLPFFGGLVGRSLEAGYSAHPLLPAVFIGLAVLVGVLAGLYPAFFLTSFEPCDTIRGKVTPGAKASPLRPVLIVFQFVLSILLVLCTLTVVVQLGYMDGRDPGFDREHLLVLTVGPDMTREDCELVKNEALRHPGIIAGTLASYLPTLGHMEYTYRVPEPVNCEMLMSRMMTVDASFIETMGMELVAGRNFSQAEGGDISRSVIINEAAARTLGYPDPVGRLLDANPGKGEENYKPVTIIGMVKDINFESFHHPILPMVLAGSDSRPARIAFRLHPGNVPEAIEHIRTIWQHNYPGAPFRYSFLDDNFASLYASEIRLRKLFGFFALLAVIISYAGLLALIAFSTERRVREIGIRKVMGASLGNLLFLFSREYIILVVIANLIAWPLAGWAMSRWLNNFAYPAPFAWYLYPLTGLLALFLALLTAGSYAWKACRSDPVKSLREE